MVQTSGGIRYDRATLRGSTGSGCRTSGQLVVVVGPAAGHHVTRASGFGFSASGSTAPDDDDLVAVPPAHQHNVHDFVLPDDLVIVVVGLLSLVTSDPLEAAARRLGVLWCDPIVVAVADVHPEELADPGWLFFVVLVLMIFDLVPNRAPSLEMMMLHRSFGCIAWPSTTTAAAAVRRRSC